MTIAYVIAGGVVVAGILIWAALSNARNRGKAEGQLNDAKATGETQKQMAQADAAGPRTGDDAVVELRKHRF